MVSKNILCKQKHVIYLYIYKKHEIIKIFIFGLKINIIIFKTFYNRDYQFFLCSSIDTFPGPLSTIINNPPITERV